MVTIPLPPLRERREDLPKLIEHFLTTRQIGKVRCQVALDAQEVLLRYDWPGNVRELANVLERAQILAENNLITIDDLPENLVRLPASAASEASALDLHGLECRHVQDVLHQMKGNKVQAAKALGVSRRALYRLIDKYQIERPTRGNRQIRSQESGVRSQESCLPDS